MVLELGAVLGVMAAFGGAIWRGARIVRWARRGQGIAATPASGLSLPPGSLSVGHFDGFRDWLGEKFDELNTPSLHGGGVDSSHSDFTHQYGHGSGSHAGAENGIDGSS